MRMTYRLAHAFTWGAVASIAVPEVIERAQLALDMLSFAFVAFMVTCALMVFTVLDV